MKGGFKAFFSQVADIIVPPRPTEAYLRTLHLEELQMLASRNFGEPLPYGEKGVRTVVWELKYHASPKAAALAGELLADELLALASEELGKPLLIPVPMHPARRAARGYNQTELLCQSALAHLHDSLEYAPDILVRIVDTKAQQGLPRHIRSRNVKGSMRVENPEHIKGRVCIVVDDVITTGATLKEAKRALRAAGARRVHEVALARS